MVLCCLVVSHAIMSLRVEMQVSNLLIMFITVSLFFVVMSVDIVLTPVVLILAADPASNLILWMSHLFDVVLNRVFLLILEAVLDTEISNFLGGKFLTLFLVSCSNWYSSLHDLIGGFLLMVLRFI